MCFARLSMSLITSFLCLHCASRSRPSGDTQELLDIKLSMFHPPSKLATSPPWLMHLIRLIVPLSLPLFLCNTFKSTIQKACECLPPAPNVNNPDWITDEFINLSRKKCDAWLKLKNAASQDTSHLRIEYNNLKKLTRVAAEKAHNSWWSEHPAEAERRAHFAVQQGRGGSLIRELRLLKKYSKPASSSLVDKTGTTLQSDSDKLNRWAEHFNEVVNCQVNVDPIPLDDLPVISPPYIHPTL